MHNVNLLDCTLRDGAYIVDGRFGRNSIKGIINRLAKANIEIIECGWLKDFPHDKDSTYFNCARELIPYIGKKNSNALYVAMIDWNRYNLDNLEPYEGDSIDAIRVVFPKRYIDEGLALVPKIKAKGYRVMVQAANSYGYSDKELLDLVDKVNYVKPISLSIVDTFGVMIKDDLLRIVSLIDNNLDKDIMLGFHSHNNQQLSFALAQDFLTFTSPKRDVIIDSSLCGMGRGAGNVNTEIVANWLNRFCGKSYDLNTILDTIDIFMKFFCENFKWGYSVPYFIAGINCTHVNNIAYLLKYHNATTRDIENILEQLSPEERIAYDYDTLEKNYHLYMNNEIDDAEQLEALEKVFFGKTVLLLAPGKTVIDEEERIRKYIGKENPLVVSINWLPEKYDCDYAFFSSIKRFEYSGEVLPKRFNAVHKIVTSNMKLAAIENIVMVNYNKLLHRKWKYYDNSLFMCLRLLTGCSPAKIAIAGFDGRGKNINYSERNFETRLDSDVRQHFNADLQDMLDDYIAHKSPQIKIKLITMSTFSIRGGGQ